MTLKEMREQVLQELEHIPKHPKLCQSDLRMCYFMSRMHSLGKKAKEAKTAFDVLQQCIDHLKMESPTADFRYDSSFFGQKTKRPVR